MANNYWYKQTSNEPLFPDLVWNRPENKKHAGKLLIIGGNNHGFSAPAGCYGEALKAGAGAVRIILPSALQKTVSKIFPEAEFAPGTPSGSFAQTALGELLPAAAWADSVLLAGDFGKNAETTLLLDSFLRKYTGPLIFTGDTLEFANTIAEQISSRPQTIVAADFTRLQKLVASAKYPKALTSGMDLLHVVEFLHDFTASNVLAVTTVWVGRSIVAEQGRVATMAVQPDMITLATYAAIWTMQHPEKTFEALATSLTQHT